MLYFQIQQESSNVALGRYALYYNTTGNYNVALGHTALYQNTTGGYNIALGTSALRYNTTGNYNVALGYMLYIQIQQEITTLL
jgi:trimeric autotransporter adhesin